MRRGRLIATGAMLAFCLFAIWQSLLLPLMDRLGPGPGFFPFWLALIGALLAVALLITTFRDATGPDDDMAVLPHGEGGRRSIVIVVFLMIATAIMDVVGFRLTMLAFNAALVVALGERRWWVIALFAIAGSYGVYHVFTTWLDVLLPEGRLGF